MNEIIGIHYPPGVRYFLRWDYKMPKGEALKIYNSIIMHPDDLICFTQAMFGSDEALNLLQKILYQYIELKFNINDKSKHTIIQTV